MGQLGFTWRIYYRLKSNLHWQVSSFTWFFVYFCPAVLFIFTHRTVLFRPDPMLLTPRSPHMILLESVSVVVLATPGTLFFRELPATPFPPPSTVIGSQGPYIQLSFLPPCQGFFSLRCRELDAPERLVGMRVVYSIHTFVLVPIEPLGFAEYSNRHRSISIILVQMSIFYDFCGVGAHSSAHGILYFHEFLCGQVFLTPIQRAAWCALTLRGSECATEDLVWSEKSILNSFKE